MLKFERTLTYLLETEIMIDKVKEKGISIWAMLAIFKKRSKLAPSIPDEVIQEVCKEYLKRTGTIRADFPYFLEVLKRKSQQYFAQKNIRENDQIKKEPVRLKITIG